MRRFLLIVTVLGFLTAPVFGESSFAGFEFPSASEVFPKDETPLQWIDNLGSVPLTWRSPHGWATFDYTGTIELEGYITDTRAPGLIMDNNSFFNYRDTNFLELWLGRNLFFFADFEDDRGFNPDNQSIHSDFQQYFVRYTPFDDPWVNVEVGKFPTPVGNFVSRYGAFDNPFVRDPLPYDFMTVLGDATAAPNSTALLNRRGLPDKKQKWIPMIWGPVYHTGVETFGSVKKFDYAFAFVNSALSTRPSQWDIDSHNDDKYNYSGRIAYTPVIGLTLGTSYATGPYLKRTAVHDWKDFNQQTFGVDAAYGIGHWQFWSEFFASDWEAPNISDKLRAYSYYVETRYKFTPGFYGSLRWGQIYFNEIDKAKGKSTPWDRDAWRVEAGLGYYFVRNLMGKVQYEHNHQNGSLQQGANMVSMQLALKM